MTPLNWFVAQLKPNGLKDAQTHLARQGFGVFVPARMETLRSGAKLKDIQKPLFPGYVFVQFDPLDRRWAAINSTRGISRLLITDRRTPTPLSSDIMGSLIARCDEDGLLVPLGSLNPGDEVRIVAGPFANTMATIEALSDDERVTLLLELVGQTAKISTDRRNVEPARG
jgi:transcriptional antiterminator RfaH